MVGPLLPFNQRLLRGTLVRRYKRFLVDEKLRNGHLVTAHTPNTGSMAGCSDPGSQVYLSRANNPKRKLPYTLELVRTPEGVLVGVNTLMPNRVFKRAVAGGALPELAGYEEVTGEVKASDHSRIDLRLRGEGRRACWVEIKNVTLVEQGVARFPDAVTARGAKHLQELARLHQRGDRAVILFAVQRADAGAVGPADRIDPHYGEVLRSVCAGGVEALAYHLEVSPEGIHPAERLPVVL